MRQNSKNRAAFPDCCQPDSECADEIRKGNPPPCKKATSKKLDKEKIGMAIGGSILLYIITTPIAIVLFSLTQTTTIAGACIYTAILCAMFPFTLLLQNKNFYYHNNEEEK